MNLIEHTPFILLGIVAFAALLAVIQARGRDIIGIIFIMLLIHLPLLGGALLLWMCPYSYESVNIYRSITWIVLGSIFAFSQTIILLGSSRYESGGEFIIHLIIMKVAFVLFAIVELFIYLNA